MKRYTSRIAAVAALYMSLALTACSQSDTTAAIAADNTNITASVEQTGDGSEEDSAEEMSEENPDGGADENDDMQHGHNGMQGNRGGMQGGNNGGMTMESDETVLAAIEEGAVKFSQDTFTDPETGIVLEYSLYIPEDYDSGKDYPLVTYVPDSTAVGLSAKDIVEQYYGADSFVTDEEQADHTCFVLVPAFTETVTTDNWETSEQIETLVRLIESLGETYSLDSSRYYMTGQSMGCMTSLYLSSIHPDLFAAYLFVSGQWDLSVLNGLEDQKFFYIVAGGDDKASAGQAEVMEMFDSDGVDYAFDEWDAQNDAATQNSSVEALTDQGMNGNFVLFTTGSVLNGGSGMEHMASFNYAYKISAVHDWLFEQSK